MNVDFVLGIIGLFGGLLCAGADVLLDLKGKGNKKYGPGGVMDSNWEKMALWRFKASIWMAAVATPMYLMGCIALYRQIAQNDAILAGVFGICAVIGSCGTLFIHATLCYFPIINKTLSAQQVAQDTIGQTISTLYHAMLVPFLALWLLLVVGLSGIAAYAILTGALALHWGFILLTPLCLVVAGVLLRLINRRIFADLPGICMPSIGLGMLGLIAAISALG
ncbi:MAG: hypothetical protein LBK67_07520 [Coriobacteriales bacterium]|jgi:hypothetical protein|nr:hypothetical protein [Coriobacteriales bacterium]